MPAVEESALAEQRPELGEGRGDLGRAEVGQSRSEAQVSTTAPPSGSGSTRGVVVWRPRFNRSEYSWVRARASGTSKFSSVDLPIPDCPTSRHFLPLINRINSLRAVSGCAFAETASVRQPSSAISPQNRYRLCS
jgi:hypothetical protein